MSKITFSGFSGMRPRLDAFALPNSGSEECLNVVFEKGGITPLLTNVIPGSDFLTIPPDSNIIAGGTHPSDYNNDLLSFSDDKTTPSVSIFRPNYVGAISGTQTAFAYFVIYKYNETTELIDYDYIIRSDETSLYGTSYRTADGYIANLKNSATEADFNIPAGWSIESSRFLGLINDINGYSADSTPTFSSPPISRGTKSFTSSTNGQNVSVTIAAGTQDVHDSEFIGHGFGDSVDVFAPLYLYFSVSHDYRQTGRFQYRYAITNENGNIIYMSDISNNGNMNVGDGVSLSVPVFQYKAPGESEFTDISKLNYRIFRSYNNGSFKEIDVPTTHFN